ncbi:family 43 glycosylhydrolase [Flavivirga abyssicola]|uniref:family 43 glycosylhydrolase n=1 Tax=Flavivirga abyssicola TaxID=3063533 RepID=UPI0026DF5ACD|nr:family 43 glycosylhydrolase [Flavivirga sp. MEBiC07777]WVK12659.1 family 43 glycosylhydrolase [Flavivirga sp. MEBiC07777]
MYKKITVLFFLSVLSVSFFSCNNSTKKTSDEIAQPTKQTVVCNPLDISYRFAVDDGSSRREAADPTVVLYKDDYYLFASKSGGYWTSNDLVTWDFITSKQLPFEDYAPTAVVIKDTLYFMASNNKAPITIYKTTDPKSGEWEVANPNFPIAMTDPALFYDEGRLFLYYGCSNKNPLEVVELDVKTLNPISEPIAILNSKKEDYGWERWGDYNDQDLNPWIEGAWVNKHQGKYYLQYAGPGTRFKSYNDGVYIADNPLGPFKLAEHNPMAIKPEGFINGAGHGNTFQDRYGNYWHTGTMVLTLKHKFERRIGMYPAFFDDDNMLYAYTGFGDFPYEVPQKKISSPQEVFPNWMLLSYDKPIRVSSELEDHTKNLASDEEVRTYWSAKTGNQGEWFQMDLEKEVVINAVQINYAEHNTTLHGRNANIYHQYLLEYSQDNSTWYPLIDKTKHKEDAPHDFTPLQTPVKARYLKMTNYSVPDGTFALADFRVFGNAQGNIPTEKPKLEISRLENDKCIVNLKWNSIDGAFGYNIRYGIHPEKLYHNYQVLKNDSLTIRTLNKFQTYYFTIDTFNENGILKGTEIIEVN